MDAFISCHLRLENFPLQCLWRVFFSLFLILYMHILYKCGLHGSLFQNRSSAPVSVFSSAYHLALFFFFFSHIDDSIAPLSLHGTTAVNYIMLPAFIMHLLLGWWPRIAVPLWEGVSRKLSSRTIFQRGLWRPFLIFCPIEKFSSGDP